MFLGVIMGFDRKRRKVIQSGVASLVAVASVGAFLQVTRDKNGDVENLGPSPDLSLDSSVDNKMTSHSNAYINQDLAVRDKIEKVKNFNNNFSDDVYLEKEKTTVFKSALSRILRVQKTIGYANFNLVSFDDMLLYAHRFPKIGKFTKEELSLIDELFFFDANKYGFYGNKVITDLTSKINKKETTKISGSGHYLFHGEAVVKFHQLQKDVGPDLILTSGVRGIVKQLQLFLAKLDSSNGNLSMASRSLAPPGHSYHGIGDFDVGKKGFGHFNFTEKFSSTEEYKKLIDLKYIDLRYTKENQIGVRYEPWHIKVV